MQEHTNAPRTEAVMLSFAVPPDRIEEVLRTMRSLGLSPTHDSTPWRDALGYTAEAMPGVLLSGARYREGLTQAQLAEKAGIPRRHISEMESGKRPIGKKNARLLGPGHRTTPAAGGLRLSCCPARRYRMPS